MLGSGELVEGFSSLRIEDIVFIYFPFAVGQPGFGYHKSGQSGRFGGGGFGEGSFGFGSRQFGRGVLLGGGSRCVGFSFGGLHLG